MPEPAIVPIAMRSEVAEQVLALYALAGDEADLEIRRSKFVEYWDTMSEDERLLVDAGLAAADLELIGTSPLDAKISANVLDALEWWQNNGALPTQSRLDMIQNRIAVAWQATRRGAPRQGTMTQRTERLVQIALHIGASTQAKMLEHIANGGMDFGDKARVVG